MTRRLGLFALLTLAGCGPKKDAVTAVADPAIPVTVAPVATQTLRRSIAVVGTLNGLEEATLAPKVDGRVISIRADVGDMALPGQTLLELDPVDFRLAVAEAREGLNAELAKLALTALPPADFDVEAVPAVRRATVARADALRKFTQKKDLLAKKAGSADEADAAETELQLADATKTQMTTEARAVLASARLKKASLDAAEQRLKDCTLTAPDAPGWAAWAAAVGPGFAPLRYSIAQRYVSEGEMIRAMPGTNAYRIVIDHVLKLKAAVPERYSAEISIGLTADVTVEAYPKQTFVGRVARVSPAVDPLNRTFQVEIEVPNPGGRLRVGGFAKAAVLTKTDAEVKTVPPQAVISFAGVTKIFVRNGDAAKSIEVVLGVRDRDWTEVTGDIPAGAEVITSGFTQLADGTPIRIKR